MFKIKYAKNENLIKIVTFFILFCLTIFVIFLKCKRKKENNIVMITFPEGLNVKETAKLLENNGVVSCDIFLSACSSANFDDFEFIKNQSRKEEKYYRLEGYLLPDTYEFFKNENVNSVINKFLRNFFNKTREIDFSKRNISIDEIITIASMLQLESDEKNASKIASIIYNRLETLKSNGKNKFGEFSLDFLQMDSTVWYPFRKKNEAPEKFNSKYNTYSIKGLPPGPICSPGIVFIKSAISPSSTDYFYFCNNEAREIFYAKTFAQHKANLELLNHKFKK
jgi:UPF0755 protein